MKITARFSSVDEAELAAIAVKRIGEGVFDVSVREQQRSVKKPDAYSPIGFFTNLTSQNTQPYAVNAALPDSYDTRAVSAAVDIICRPSAAGAVSSVLISHGGHDLRGE